jgi:F-type H+-transporting ATPase subunit delta
MTGIRISSRYAKSLLQLCMEKGQVDAVFADMKMVHTCIDENRELKVLLNSPVVNHDKKVDIINAIFASQINVITKSFMTLLVNKGRASLLHEVAQSYVDQVKIYQNITTVELKSAIPLDAETRNKIAAVAAQIAGGTVELEEKVDADLIGGFILKVGDKQIDASIASEIKSLRLEFDKNPYVAEL